MNVIKLDEEKIKKCIEAYRIQHDAYPYLICSEETADLFDFRTKIRFANGCSVETIPSSDTKTNTTTFTFGNVSVESKEPKKYGTFYGSKILIDNDLPYGEIHIG